MLRACAISLLFALAASPAATHAESLDFDGLRCKLPGWPGHAAPTCDPQVPGQCCAGTNCMQDPFDQTHYICRNVENLSPAEHALTIQALGDHVSLVVESIIGDLRTASVGLYLSDPDKRTMTDSFIIQRAQNLVSAVKTEKGKDHPVYGGRDRVPSIAPAKGRKDGKQKGEDNGENGGFDYSQYVPHGKSSNKVDDADSDKPDNGQNGFDYSKYYPMKKQPDSPSAEVRKASKAPSANNGDHSDDGADQGGFDYSQYYPGKGGAGGGAGGGYDYSKYYPGNGSPTGQGSKDGGSGAQGGYDYSQYYPGNSAPAQAEATKGKKSDSKSEPTNSQNGFDYSKYMPGNTKNKQDDDDDDDFLKDAAIRLLETDLQLRSSATQTRKDVLEKVRTILIQALDRIDEDLDKIREEHSDDGYRPGLDGTQSPTLVWESGNPFWAKYIPDLPVANTGDRRPGSLGGPCGKTIYKEFGDCKKGLYCKGLDQQKPGLCQMNRTAVVEHSNIAALRSIARAEDVLATIKVAAIEMLVANAEQIKNDNEKDGNVKPMAADDNGQSEEALKEYSPGVVAVVLLGFAVIGYFCFIQGLGKRNGYSQIDGWAKAGERA